MSVAKFNADAGKMDITFVSKNGFDCLWNANMDLTGFTFDGGVYDLKWNRVADFVVTPKDLLHGQVEWSLASVSCLALKSGYNNYYYDMSWFDASTKMRTIANGFFNPILG
jgi:hypothetical protein